MQNCLIPNKKTTNSHGNRHLGMLDQRDRSRDSLDKSDHGPVPLIAFKLTRGQEREVRFEKKNRISVMDAILFFLKCFVI